MQGVRRWWGQFPGQIPTFFWQLQCSQGRQLAGLGSLALTDKTCFVLQIVGSFFFFLIAWHILASSVAHCRCGAVSFFWLWFVLTVFQDGEVSQDGVGGRYFFNAFSSSHQAIKPSSHQAIKPCRFPMLSALHDVDRFPRCYHSARGATSVSVPMVCHNSVLVMWYKPQEWKRVTLKLGGLRCLWVCATSLDTLVQSFRCAKLFTY